MKTLLQLNLESLFNKNYYRIRKNCLQITKQNPPVDYHFDNICYSSQDINSSIIYDIVLDFSEKNKFEDYIESSLSIQMEKEKQTQENNQQKILSDANNTINYINAEKVKQPDFSYIVMFDQIQDKLAVQDLLNQIRQTEVFKRQKIQVGHFLIHQNGIYDFHKQKIDLSQSQRQQLKRQTEKSHSIQDNFMWLYNKQINLCQQVKASNIQHVYQTINYISANQFCSLINPSLGVQFTSNFIKSQEIKHKQLQNKKTTEIYIINIDTKIRIIAILLNYNKNYSMSAQEQKQFTQLLMMYGSVMDEIKYKTTKIQIINSLFKKVEKLYYVMYFPGPRLSNFAKQVYQADMQQRETNSLNANRSTLGNKLFNDKLISLAESRTSTLTQQYMKQIKLKQTSSMCNSRSNISTPQQRFSAKATQYSRVNSYQGRYYQHMTQVFANYNALKTEDKDNLQKIVKQYLAKKEDNLKDELERVKQRVKQLKLTHRIQQCDIAQLKCKCTKALEKMSQSTIELQKMGIKNVQRHMEWLKLMSDQKRQQIKQQQEQIEEINKKIIEGRQSHQYFSKKMLQFKDRLKMKQIETFNQTFTQRSVKGLSKINDKQNLQKPHSQTVELNSQQYEQLEQYKENLKSKMVQKLQNSQEKKSFVETLAEIKIKVSKLQLSKLQQRYFDLLHN